MSVTKVFRLTKKKWRALAFDGEGARRFGGRWNSRGRRCVYASGSESLALLEVMVHLDDYHALSHYTMFELTLDSADITMYPTSRLPADWREEPAPASTAAIGDAWLDLGEGLALAVPSVVVPREKNFLLNPERSDWERLMASAREIEFEKDLRL